VQLEHARPNRLARRWYCTTRWQYLRMQVLVEAASQCAQCGQVQRRLEVDHIVKHDGNSQMFWDRSNLQVLCPSCHQAKTKRGA